MQDKQSINDILQRAVACRIALCDGSRPYLVPMNFGYDGNCLYLHSGARSRKVDIIKRNPLVCFQADVDTELTKAETPCKWGMKYRSVIGEGRADLVTNRDEKVRCLDVIMCHYGWDKKGFPEQVLDKVAVIKVVIDKITFKSAGY